MEECCALCERKATMQCDSDQAKLCWNCDERVHSANFLVAKHSRVLLCGLCHSLTPWKASGPKLTPTVSFCHRCVADRRASFQHAPRDYVDDDGEYSSDHVCDDSDSDDDDDDDDDDGNNGDGEEEEEEDDEDGENQVVPMSSASASSPPDAAALSSKRLRDNSFSLDSHGETGCSSSEMVSAALPGSDESTSVSDFRPLKEHRINKPNY